jgi:NAD(P)-dependent dehydrogenase (short-subunit alcohol dehydrogenase family)
MLLRDRVAIVSGVGPGMGRDIAFALANQGAKIVLAARTEKKLQQVADELDEHGHASTFLPTDITDEEQCRALAEHALAEFGRIDVLVNNAFVQPPFERITDAPMQTWQSAFDLNVFGGVRMTNAVVPAMRDQGKGSIVFINSMSARRVRENFAVYSAAKAALMVAARHYANELGRDGIRVNSVVPGYIWGPSVEWFFNHQAEQRGISPQQVYDEVASETCLHHLPTSAEIADTVVFFASDLSRVVTGQALDVNAGHWFH